MQSDEISQERFIATGAEVAKQVAARVVAAYGSIVPGLSVHRIAHALSVRLANLYFVYGSSPAVDSSMPLETWLERTLLHHAASDLQGDLGCTAETLAAVRFLAADQDRLGKPTAELVRLAAVEHAARRSAGRYGSAEAAKAALEDRLAAGTAVIVGQATSGAELSAARRAGTLLIQEHLTAADFNAARHCLSGLEIV